MITTLLDYIKVYKGVLTSEECDKVVSHPANDKTWELSLPAWDRSRNYMISNRRKCDYINISTGGKDYKDIDSMLYTKFSDIMKQHAEDSYLALHEDSGYILLKYNKGGGYIRHIDASSEVHNHISCVLLLNDDFEGGELTFFGSDDVDEYTPKVNKGDMILFPSNYMYPHTINRITSGTRYVVATWFR
tara:strand:+ start:450 stop:1016 length:567 start_codon:yes stop_codon:yes gene_type:complete